MTESQIQALELRLQSDPRCRVIRHTKAMSREVAEKHERIVRTCIHCKVQFAIKPFRLKHGGGQFCTRNCHTFYLRKVREEMSDHLQAKRREQKRAYMAAYRAKKAGAK